MLLNHGKPYGYIKTEDIQDNVVSEYSDKPLSANQGRILNNTTLDLSNKIGNSFSFTLNPSNWKELSNSFPFTYSNEIDLNDILEKEPESIKLINNNAIVFSNYGFSIGTYDETTKLLNIYSIGLPADTIDIILKISF